MRESFFLKSNTPQFLNQEKDIEATAINVNAVNVLNYTIKQ